MDERKQPAQVDEYIYMNNDLFKAAEDGNMEEVNKYEGDLRYLVNRMQNTVLHIHTRTSSKNWVAKREFSNKFVEQLVNRCPALLWQTNAEGQIPLHVAARYRHSKMVEFVIEHTKQLERDEDLEKGKISEATSSNSTITQMLQMIDEEENTPLHKAVESGNADVVGLLVKELGPDFPFSANKSGETPLYLAAKRGHCDLVNLILEKCKSMSMDFSGPNSTTVMHAAVMSGDKRIVRKLGDAKIDLMKIMDDNGRTPLHYAAHLGYTSIVAVLLEMDASLAYIRDKERGATPLHMASWSGYYETMEEIIKYCPDCCDIVDKNYGWNFLHFAFVALSNEGIKKIVSKGDGYGNKFRDLPIKDLLNVADVNGITPLHVLCLGPAYHLTLDFGEFEVSKLFTGYDISLSDYIETKIFKTIKKRQVWKSLNEIGNNVQVAGTQVDDFFFFDMDEAEKYRKEWQEAVDKATEAHLVVVALIATVTFAAAFTMPGGYNQEKGTAIMTHHSAFQAFLISDTLAFIFSIVAIFLHFLVIYMRLRASTLFQMLWILLADVLTFMAMIAMVIAFSTGTYAVLQSSVGFAITTCSLALTSVLGMVLALYYWWNKF